uniref:Uncharacterized protein n=1 Tax=Chromera velia CCMP2878 TaxID=1169474 RepID=A0A0G4HCD8_9ALVE|eukprot:Cvel_26185.t1-p1 / transcript=Cvel_26185.t1 / gene=Cvel_26185 / organism=Chromera_velia_CCMP2878 / gene_product=hypothetical protein / transcript_product=hypothetical protein / location=Cvel_scaffold3079:11968-14322(+) / protein_length=175 / sequence_SO=supercontig / SO=protein_coding / is_pseudo=false
MSGFAINCVQWDLPEKSARGAPAASKSIPFEGNSTYKQEYDSKPLPDRVPATKTEWRPNLAAFDGNTTNKTFHDPKPLGARETFQPRVHTPKRVPFDGSSNYRDEYKKWELEQRAPPKSVDYRRAPDNRDFGSTYGKDFKKYAFPKCPIHELPPYPQPPADRYHVFYDDNVQQWY